MALETIRRGWHGGSDGSGQQRKGDRSSANGETVETMTEGFEFDVAKRVVSERGKAVPTAIAIAGFDSIGGEGRVRTKGVVDRRVRHTWGDRSPRWLRCADVHAPDRHDGVLCWSKPDPYADVRLTASTPVVRRSNSAHVRTHVVGVHRRGVPRGSTHETFREPRAWSPRRCACSWV